AGHDVCPSNAAPARGHSRKISRGEARNANRFAPWTRAYNARPRPIAGECRTPMRLRLFAAATLSALALTLHHTPPAEACGNVTREEVDAGVKNVKLAAAALEAEDVARAKRIATDAANVIGQSDDMTHHARADLEGVYRRAVRIEALATSRLATASAQDQS